MVRLSSANKICIVIGVLLFCSRCYWGVFFHGWKQDVAGVGAHREWYYDSLLASEGALEDSGCPDSLASERW